MRRASSAAAARRVPTAKQESDAFSRHRATTQCCVGRVAQAYRAGRLAFIELLA
jgi:hypothetical protein